MLSQETENKTPFILISAKMLAKLWNYLAEKEPELFS